MRKDGIGICKDILKMPEVYASVLHPARKKSLFCLDGALMRVWKILSEEDYDKKCE